MNTAPGSNGMNGTPIGVGAAPGMETLGALYDRGLGAGWTANGDMSGWRSMPLSRLAMLSPVIALVLARGDRLVPFIANIKGTFSDPTVSNIVDLPMEGGSGGPLSQASVIDHLDYQINEQNAFSGQTLKSMADFFFNMTSPISAKLTITSAPRYVVAPFYTPIRTLIGILRRNWPTGWFLNAFDGIQMSFNMDFPPPSLPVTVCVTFCMWTPLDSRYAGMSNQEALLGLARCGVCIPVCDR